jgi:demethylmenaquinone methyltransferase/2-methoxy-6-polyprenyl-1,4-benzoquinol methylase
MKKTVSKQTDSTHFGYETVAREAKASKVRAVFESVAPSYDLMNDLMSLGAHRAWKAFALGRTGLRAGDVALDLAAGTGDLTVGMAQQVGDEGHVFHTDINPAMLAEGRDRLFDCGMANNVTSLLVDAEKLPFPDNFFKCITIGFGLRNVTNKSAALKEMARVMQPGGRVLVLEFSKPILKVIEPLYDAYSFKVLPALGKLIADDADSYRYLAESIRMHPDQETLRQMMLDAGLEDCTYQNLSAGIVALHVGYSY